MKFPTKFPSPARAQAESGRVSAPAAVACLLGVALVLRIGLPIWERGAQDSGLAASSAPAAAAAQGPDLAALQSLRLFDSPGSAAPAAGAPETTTALDLRLDGVMLSGDGSNSLAVITSGGAQGTYRNGEALPVGTNITVAGIARDHVVIDNRGQRETLWLSGGSDSANVNVGTAATGSPAAGLSLPPGTDARVLKTAARLAEIIRVDPERANGDLIGYRLSPGARLKDFVQLGFQTNDIVVAANGIALNDMTNLPKLYSLMDGATEVSFSLLRDGAPLTLKVTLSPETPAN